MSAPRPLVGIALHPDRAFLALNRELIEDGAELFEVMPEAMWAEDAEPGAGWHLFREIKARSGRPFVAHGTLFSLGAALPPPRRARWIAALRRDREAFELLWFSDHLGFADCGEAHIALPLPLPPTAAAAAVCADALAELRAVFPLVAFENNVGYFSLGDPLAEPAWFTEVCARSGAGIVLDLHNAFTTCRNFGLSVRDWIARVDLGRVVEIHVSGGSDSDPGWLRSQRVYRLDSHDAAVPEPVWDLLAAVLPHCSALRAVIVEQVPDEVDASRARVLADDFERARALVRSRPARAPGPVPSASLDCPGPPQAASLAALQRALLDALLAAAPAQALSRALEGAGIDAEARAWLAEADGDGLCLTGVLIQKLRFERLMRGDPSTRAAFERDAAGFVARWRAFAGATPPAVSPQAEARAFARWFTNGVKVTPP